MLIGRKNTPVTWTLPSNNQTVHPYGEPHWSSSLGDAAILDFRIQMATSEDFKTTKAHWLVLRTSNRTCMSFNLTLTALTIKYNPYTINFIKQTQRHRV